MNLKRALWTGALLWIFIFFEVSILIFGFGLSTEITSYLVQYVLLIVLVVLTSIIYFNGKKIRKGWLEGLYLGIAFLIIGIILDMIIIIPLFVNDFGAFSVPFRLIEYLIVLLVALIVGAIKK